MRREYITIIQKLQAVKVRNHHPLYSCSQICNNITDYILFLYGNLDSLKVE